LHPRAAQQADRPFVEDQLFAPGSARTARHEDQRPALVFRRSRERCSPSLKYSPTTGRERWIPRPARSDGGGGPSEAANRPRLDHAAALGKARRSSFPCPDRNIADHAEDLHRRSWAAMAWADLRPSGTHGRQTIQNTSPKSEVRPVVGGKGSRRFRSRGPCFRDKTGGAHLSPAGRKLCWSFMAIITLIGMFRYTRWHVHPEGACRVPKTVRKPPELRGLLPAVLAVLAGSIARLWLYGGGPRGVAWAVLCCCCMWPEKGRFPRIGNRPLTCGGLLVEA